MLRSTPIKHYLSFMLAGGHAASDVLSGTAIDAADLQAPDHLVSIDDFRRVLENMLRLAGDGGLGFDIGMRMEAWDYGILAYAGMFRRTIREGMEDVWSRYGAAFGVMTRFRITDLDASSSLIEMITPALPEPVQRYVTEESLCVLSKIGAAVSGTPPPLLTLRLAYPEPLYARRYRDVLACPVEFGCGSTALLLSREWLDRRLKTHDQELDRLCQARLAQVLRQLELQSPLETRLRELLLARDNGFPSIDEAAGLLGMSARTLARQLRHNGTGYRRVVEELRAELAQHWLRSSRVPAKEIAWRLGFADVAAFRRAFKTWTGKTVQQFCGDVAAMETESAAQSAPASRNRAS